VYEIRPLHVGTLTVDKSTLTYMRGFGEKIEVPCIMWLIQGQGRTVIVDTGPPDEESSISNHGPMVRTPDQDPERALEIAGIEPKSVETVVLTHLHWDHAYNNHLFPRARFLVQQRELDYARNPLPIHAHGYESPAAGYSQDHIRGTQWTTLDGDEEIYPGMRLLLTPGHTPGLQAVSVETQGGQVIIASDNVPLMENWRGEPPLIPHLPSGIHVDLGEYFQSLDRLGETGARILPGHDFAVFQL